MAVELGVTIFKTKQQVNKERLPNMKQCVQEDHRQAYIDVLNCLIKKDVPFVLGGAMAVYHYTGIWRHTHDIDVFVSPEHVPRAIEALSAAGFKDLGEQAPGDREWIYHGLKGDIICDVIWRFANRITYVDEEWIKHSDPGEFLGVPVRYPPMEELVWSKIFTMNRHRCDWPDIMKVLRIQCRAFNWERFLDMLAENWLLLAGLVHVFDWVFPSDAECIPGWVRDELERRVANQQFEPGPSKEHLLDPWIHTRPEDLCD